MLNKEQKLKLDVFKKKKRDSIHSMHKYFGKILPAISDWAINEFSNPGDIIYDPFTGSGTVGVEAILNNRNFIGTEISPLSSMIAKAKTSRYSNKVYDKYLKKIEDNYKEALIPPFVYNSNHWFDNKNLLEIKGINDSIKRIENLKYKNLFLAISSSLIRNVSYADPSHVFPGKSKRMLKKINEGYKAPSFKKLFLIKAKNLCKKYPSLFLKSDNSSLILNISAASISSKICKKVDLIITNPPYISSIRYEEATKLELYAMEIVTSQKEFLYLGKKYTGTEKHGTNELKDISSNYIKNIISNMSVKDSNTVNRFFRDMILIIGEWKKILKKGGKVVIKIGDSVLSKTKISTGEIIAKIACDNGFKHLSIFKDKIGQRSFTSFRNKNSGIIIYDNILILEKI